MTSRQPTAAPPAPPPEPSPTGTTTTGEATHGRIEAVLDAYTSHHPDDHAGVDLIRTAYAIADRAHTGQYRATGDPYITHPVAVATVVADYGMDAATVAAALCHDVVEDTEVSTEKLTSLIGAEAATLVAGVTKLSQVTSTSRAHVDAANLRKLLLAATADPRVLVLKVADRMHNASTLAPLPEPKKSRIAKETLDVYAPIAHRLGMNEAAAALEDHAFAVLQPDVYADLSRRMDQVEPRREEKLAHVSRRLADLFTNAGMSVQLKGRNKHVYSTWRKINVRSQAFSEIADLIGVRVLVEETADCYTALGLLHTQLPALPDRFRDYIATPKYGHYQSLHTTVVIDGTVVEVQIRTWRMHVQAEAGIAAHWRYKEQPVPDSARSHTSAGPAAGGQAAAPPRATVPNLPWLAPLLQSGAAAESSPEEFLAAVRKEIDAGEVVVFTPKGDPVTLPEGATVLDAAYALHTDLGNTFDHAVVNGRIRHRSYRLRPGDLVQVVTTPDAVPQPSWMVDAQSLRARHALRDKLRTLHRDEHRRRAWSALTGRTAQLLDTTPGRVVSLLDEDTLATVASKVGYATSESLLDVIEEREGLLEHAAATTAELLRPRADSTHDSAPVDADTRPAAGASAGQPDWSGSFAAPNTCCTVIPGNEAIGTLHGAELHLHGVECGAVADTQGPLMAMVADPERCAAHGEVVVTAWARRRLVADLERAVEEAGAYLSAIELGRTADRARATLMVGSNDADALWRTRDLLRSVDGVLEVR